MRWFALSEEGLRRVLQVEEHRQEWDFPRVTDTTPCCTNNIQYTVKKTALIFRTYRNHE